MKKIIRGKVYDTDTAEKVGGWAKGLEDNLYWVEEELYRKRTGEFFLCGSGGPGSKYAVSTGDSNWRSGEEIIPLSYQAAQEWAEKRLSADEYEAIFGEVVEDDSKTMMTIYLPTATAERVKRAAQAAGKSISSYVDEILSEGVSR